MRKSFNSIVISLLMLIMNFSYAWAQVSLKDLSVNYKDLRLDKGYSIIYDNPNAAAKLNEFKIKFYKDATFIDETRVETFPPNGTIVTYGLTNSVIGFNKAELSIISLHSGNIIDFPASAASIIALNEPTEVKPTDSASTPAEPVDNPFLSNKLSNDETLTLTAPSGTDTYTIPYEVQDRQEASASADVLKAQEGEIRELQAELTKETNRADSLLTLLKDRDATIAAIGNLPAASATIESQQALKTENTTLKVRVKELETTGPSASQWPSLFSGLSLLALGGILGWTISRLKRRSPPKKDPTHLKKSIIFSGSPMLSGPLPIALAHCEEAYNAVGRIGKAQQGVPTGEDEPFGTGILIAPNKVLTNHHVIRDYESIGQDPDIGIEFFGEKDSDRSEFITFDTTIAPVILAGYDAAILTLKDTSPNRVPISMTSQPAASLSGREIVVIGYPYTYWSQEDEIVSATQEDEPILGVKRYSEAKIFDHSIGRQIPYGVQAPVSDHIHPSRTMRAICHDASTLGGSSGSAVICKESGELIALHFGFDKKFGEAEDTNFAIPGEDIAQIILETIDPDVTPITDKKLKTPYVNS